MRTRIALAAFVLALPSCQCSHVGGTPSTPVAAPAAPTAPETGEAVTLSMTVAPGGGLHLVCSQRGHDPVVADVPATPRAADLAPALVGVTPNARLIVAAGEDVPQAAVVRLLDALRAAGFTRFAVSR